MSQLDSSVSSFKDPYHLEEEFTQQQLIQEQRHQKKSEFEVILKEIKNSNAYKQKQIQKLVEIKQIPKIIVQEIQSLIYDDSQVVSSLEINKQLQIHIDELVKSINKKKQSNYDIEHQVKLLKYQEKQANDELILAEFEMMKSKQLLQSMKLQIQQLQHKRNQYLQDLMNKNNVQRATTEENKKEYQLIADQVNSLRDQIQEQKQQIEELKQQERIKWESSGNQMIIITNYLAMTKLYEYCINETGNIEMDESCFNVSDSEDEIVEIESPDMSSGEEGIFQTQIKQSIPKQSSKSLKSIKKSSQQKINYQQSLKNFIAAKELISKVKQDINIGIIEEVILKKHLEETTLQQQLADQHTYLIEQRDECIREINNLYSKLFLGGDENNEKIIKCNRPSNDNFNQDVITPNIAQSSVTNKLKIIQTLKKRTQMEELFLCLNSRATLFLNRVINLIHNMSQRSEIMNPDLVSIYQNAQINLNFMKQQQQQCTFDDYPNFKELIKTSNLALLYQDQQIFEEFETYCQSNDETILISNFDAFIQLCFSKIVTESQFIYEQIAIIFNKIKKEIEHLHHLSYRSSIDLNSFPHIVQMTYNLTAEKLQNYTDSKLSDPSSTVKRKQTTKKSELIDELNSQKEEEKDENYEQYYLQIKNQIENPSLKRETQTDSTSIAKTTLLYENQTPRGEFIKQNRKIASSLNRIQSLSHIYNQLNNREQNSNFKFALNKEQKTIQFLTRTNSNSKIRRDSHSQALMSTFRQQCQTEHTEKKGASTPQATQQQKVLLMEAKRSLKNIKKINKLQFVN